MSTVNIVIGVVFLVCVLAGMWQGMFRVLISVAGLIASMVVAVYIAPHVSGYIEQNTQVDEKLAQYITDKLQFSESGEETSRGIQVALIEELPLPETMKQNIIDNNNSEMYGVLNAVGGVRLYCQIDCNGCTKCFRFFSACINMPYIFLFFRKNGERFIETSDITFD